MKINSMEFFLKKISSTKKKIYSKKVLKIVNDIYKYKDKSLEFYTKKYDNIDFKKIKLDLKKISTNCLSKKKKKSIIELKNRILLFHTVQKKTIFKSWFYKDKYFEILGQKVTPIRKIGIYVPAGRALYPSSLLMSIIPAKIAGVKKIYVISPIKKIKYFIPIIYTAKIVGIKKIYRLGGAQAIAAFALGTESIKPIDKIVGPGNYYVSNSKKILFGNVGIDMYAGPTELMILCDKNTNIKYVVYDALSQMEHDTKSELVIISRSRSILKKIIKLLKISYKNKINKFVYFIYEKKIKNIFKIVNKYAPEHLEIFFKNSNKYLNYIRNSGSIFLGDTTTECLGDYAAGCNHILPTKFCSRFSSPLGVNDFLKFSNVTKVKKKKKIFKVCTDIAKIENLRFHYKSLLTRINDFK
ncbi:histidinol dehydrogenase [Candidatus Vidania fulgoroideorum]